MRTSNHLMAEPWTESSFTLDPKWAAPSRGPHEGQLDDLKSRLARPLLEQAEDPRLRNALSYAATEAAALAWCTGFPLLTFPALLEEKARAARRRWEQQERLRQGYSLSLAA